MNSPEWAWVAMECELLKAVQGKWNMWGGPKKWWCIFRHQCAIQRGDRRWCGFEIDIYRDKWREGIKCPYETCEAIGSILTQGHLQGRAGAAWSIAQEGHRYWYRERSATKRERDVSYVIWSLTHTQLTKLYQTLVLKLCMSFSNSAGLSSKVWSWDYD